MADILPLASSSSFIEGKKPYFYFKARTFWEWTTAVGSSLDVDPGEKLCYIILRYNIFGMIPLYDQNHTLGV